MMILLSLIFNITWRGGGASTSCRYHSDLTGPSRMTRVHHCQCDEPGPRPLRCFTCRPVRGGGWLVDLHCCRLNHCDTQTSVWDIKADISIIIIIIISQVSSLVTQWIIDELLIPDHCYWSRRPISRLIYSPSCCCFSKLWSTIRFINIKINCSWRHISSSHF